MPYIIILMSFLLWTEIQAANPCLEEYKRCNDTNWAERKSAAAQCKRNASSEDQRRCLEPLKSRWKNRDLACKASRSQCLSSHQANTSSKSTEQLMDDLGIADYQREKEYHDYLEAVRREYCEDGFRICIAESRRLYSPFTQEHANLCRALERSCASPDLDAKLFNPKTGLPSTDFINMLKQKLRNSTKSETLPQPVEKAIYSATGVRG